MSESEVKKCPKCDRQMEKAKRLVAYVRVTLAKKGDIFGDNVVPFYCKNCGYIELYKEIKKE